MNSPKHSWSTEKLPWIWPYTAGAICAFAFNKEVPVVDINIKSIYPYIWIGWNILPKDLELLHCKCVPKGRSCNGTMHSWTMVRPCSIAKQQDQISETIYLSVIDQTGQRQYYQTSNQAWKHIIQEARNKFPHKDFDGILEKMVDQWLITINNQTILL